MGSHKVLDPILFLLYLLQLGSIIARNNLLFHCFADDLQIYLPLKPSRPSNAQSTLFDCIADIKQWSAQTFLHLNEDKQKVLCLGNLC